jgi:energy-coupling factor transport system ATP-binding protein
MIIGKNGAGKSTLLSALGNIYQYQGDIYLDNHNIKKIDNITFRKKIGIVFQNPNNQIIFNNIADEFKFVLNNLNLKYSEKEINSVLELVSMNNYLNSNPYELSLGQKQRICLASVLKTKPKYLLLDEITAMLDYQGKKDLYQIITKLKEDGLGIIMGTNILDELVYADQIIILDGEVKEVLFREQLLNNLDILTKYGFNIPFNLKVINKLKIPFTNYDEDEIMRFIHE